MAREKPLDSAVVQAWPAAWARDHHLTGIGVDISTVFIGSARARTAELGVADRVSFVHGDASGYVASQPVSIASCIGATWIGRGGARARSACSSAVSSLAASC